MLDSTSSRPLFSFLLNPSHRTASFEMNQSLQPQTTSSATPTQNHPTKIKNTQTPRSSFSDSHKTFTPSETMTRKRSSSHSDDDDHSHDDDNDGNDNDNDDNDDNDHSKSKKKECCGCGGTKCADKKKKKQQQENKDSGSQDSRKAFIRSLEW
ncbi:uncharacterized protein SAPINGB_P005250 [Magnusiomyces paraingens]|uniref:Uncharacterized protein n=1 Tax=Magnusiomyces paraingens TaxID=2606893 RepID=A0A5E8C6A2_9ASCO|nr:uncharacterized protein SAPINGB_P005250 [Saprochaete ingens]VVT56756.1 unnamed protein product [Saprochaete ingens]